MERSVNRWTIAIIGLVALVAGAAPLVYARDGGGAGMPQAPRYTQVAQVSERLPDTLEGQEDPDSPKVIYDPGTLPDPVQRMLGKIVSAAQTGNLEAMRTALEANELKPMVAAAHVSDPIDYWNKQSADGTGRDVLAAMLNIITSGGVLTGKGHDAMYVWPYFAETDIAKLTPPQLVEFYRVVPPKAAAAILKSGKYDYYRLGISPAGVWHYFIR